MKMKLKGLHFADVSEIQETITDEVKKVQKEEFSVAFQKLYDRAKACIYAYGVYFEFKKRPFSCVSQLKKNQPSNFWTALCVTGLATCAWISCTECISVNCQGNI